MTFTRAYAKAVSIGFLVLATSSPAWSQTESRGFAKEGGFAGVTFVPQFTFDGVTFDGQTGYKEIDGDELVFLPKVDKQNVMRPVLGYRGRTASLEISYDHTVHNGTFADVPMKATFNSVNIDGRYYFATRSRIQPHVLVGGSYPWLNIKDGSFLHDEFGDAHFKGYGLNAEAGVTVYPHRQLGIGVGYVYRRVWFERVTGVSETLFDLRPRFRETSGSIALSGTFIF